MAYFDTCTTLNELKSLYKKLALTHHPDMGGDTATMQAINAEYDKVFEALKARQNKEAKEPESNVKPTTETPEEFRVIVDILLHLDSIEVELCGSWLWITGDTYPHKEKLKKAGCKYSGSKKKWYWHHPEEGTCRSRGTYTMKDIRLKYGSSYLTQVTKDNKESEKLLTR